MTQLNCHIKSVQSITDTVFRVLLTPEHPVHFKAGQYLAVVMGENDKRVFSIASSPTDDPTEIELHIGASDQNAYAKAVMDKLLVSTNITVDMPLGDAWLRENNDHPLLLIAGGTGYSYIRSILVNALVLNPQRNIAMYWGGQEAKHLYDLNFLEALSITHSNLKVTPVIERIPDDVEWEGKIGRVLDVVLQDFDTLSQHDIYIAGRFDMANVARERFTQERGARITHIFSDAYSFI